MGQHVAETMIKARNSENTAIPSRIAADRDLLGGGEEPDCAEL